MIYFYNYSFINDNTIRLSCAGTYVYLTNESDISNFKKWIKAAKRLNMDDLQRIDYLNYCYNE